MKSGFGSEASKLVVWDDLSKVNNRQPVEKDRKIDYLSLAKEQEKQNQLQKAESSYRKAIAENPACWSAYQCLAELLNSTNQKEAVLVLFRQGIQQNPRDSRYVFAIAKALSEQEKWHYASLRYQEALKIAPDRPDEYLNWAKVSIQLKKWQSAQNALKQALRLNSQLWDAYHHLGKIFQHRHQWQLALQAYKKVIQLNPSFMHAYMRLAEVYHSLKQHQSAIKCYSYAIDNAVANSLVQQKAIARYEETLAKHLTPTPQQYYEFGNLCRAKSYFAKAITAYQKAIELDPQFNLAYINLQYTPIEKQQLSSVIEFYRRLVAENPQLSLAWGNLGDVYSQQNNIKAAIDCYRTSCYKRITNLYPQLTQLDWQKSKQKDPDFIIIGASKCGTSSLHTYLSYHPQILLSHKKEIDFFWRNFGKGIDWYLSHFPVISDRQNFVTGEATPNYLRFPQVARRIKKTCPTSKLIVLLRNPVERAISWHYHKINTGLTTGSLEDAIAYEMKRLKNLDEERLTRGGYHKIDNIFSSLYYYQLKSWLKYFPREQFLILQSEEFYTQTSTVMKKVFDFLGLPPQQLTEYPKTNVGAYKVNCNAIEEQLNEYFKPYNQQLEELLNMQFDW